MGFRRRGTVAPVATIRTGAAVVSKRDKLDGWDTLYHHGGDTKPDKLARVPMPRSSEFQPVTVQLQFERLNGFLYRAGQVGFGAAMRAGYLSFKVVPRDARGSTLGDNSGTGRMAAPKRYTRVQRIPRYNAAPKTYPTRAAK